MTATFSNKLAVSTSCLGLHPSHGLEAKLRAAASHGFTGIEIVYADLERYSKLHGLSMTAAAKKIRQICGALGLHVLSLCPLENFEGTKSPLKERLENAERWISLARILRATYIQVPAQYDTEASSEETLIVSELQRLADLGTVAQPAVSIAYEPMSWSICYSTWESSLRLAKLVNRPNFGICLDSFHIASKLWGCNSAPSGKYPDADQALSESMSQLVKEFPLEKLFYIQLSDGERFNPLYSKDHPWYLGGEAPEFTWSKHARPFPLETELGGYFPVVEIVKSWIIEKGFNGWVSLETFDRRMRDPAFEPETGARRAKMSIQRLRKAADLAQSRL